MANKDFSNTDYGEHIPSSLPVEDVLGAFANELKHPINSIKGWVRILSLETDKEPHPQALESISHNLERMEMLLKAVKIYLDEHSRK